MTTAKIEGNELVIRLPINPQPPLSKTGQSRILAGTSGYVDANIDFQGKPIRISVNAIIKP